MAKGLNSANLDSTVADQLLKLSDMICSLKRRCQQKIYRHIIYLHKITS